MTVTAITRNQISSIIITTNVLMVSGNLIAGDLGAGAIYTSTGAGPSGPMAIQDINGTWYQLVLSDVALTGWFDTLANADAAASAANVPLVINSAHTLSSGQTLNANLIVQGAGAITLGDFNLTITGTVNAPLSRWLICAGTGMAAFSQNLEAEIRWFAVGDGVTDDTVSAQAWLNSSVFRHASAGQYLVDTLNINVISGSVNYGHILGDGQGPGQTQFISKNGNDIFLFQASKLIDFFTIGNFWGTGQGAGIGSGYVVNNPASSNMFNSEVINIAAQNIGGGCVKSGNSFSMKYSNLWCNNGGGHCFDIRGDNTVYMEHCYASNVQSGKAGYRIHSGAVLRDCNGLDQGGIWGIFGSSTTDVVLPAGITGGPITIPADGIKLYSSVKMEGCNVEDYSAVGIVCLNGSVSIDIRTTMVAKSTGVVIPIYLAGDKGAGIIEYYENIIRTAGATFYQSCPIHIGTSLLAPYFIYIGSNSVTYVPFWDFANSIQRNFSTISSVAGGFVPSDGILTSAYSMRLIRPEHLMFTQTTPSKTGAGIPGEFTVDANNFWLCSNSGKWLAIGDPVKQVYSTNSSTSASLVLVAADIFGGATEHTLGLTGAISGASNAQLPTVSALVTGISNALSGQTYKLRVINIGGTGSGVWTITTNTGWTLSGTMTIAVGGWRDFYVTLNSLTTATMQSVGTGTNS